MDSNPALTIKPSSRPYAMKIITIYIKYSKKGKKKKKGNPKLLNTTGIEESSKLSIERAADFSKETLVVKEEETYDACVFERVEAKVVKLLKELWSPRPSHWWSHPQDHQNHPRTLV